MKRVKWDANLYEAIGLPIGHPPKMEIYYNDSYLTALGAAPRCKKIEGASEFERAPIGLRYAILFE